MSLLNLATIKDKLIAITMISCVTSLVVAGSAMILYSWGANKDNTVTRLHVLSTVLGDRSKAALIFDDTTQINENLQSLKFEPGVLLACIYSNGKTLEKNHLVGEYISSIKQRQK